MLQASTEFLTIGTSARASLVHKIAANQANVTRSNVKLRIWTTLWERLKCAQARFRGFVLKTNMARQVEEMYDWRPPLA
jgi:hypothetical protein